MQSLDPVLEEVAAIERQLGRRGFLKFVALLTVISGATLEAAERKFLSGVAAELFPQAALATTGIDVVQNIERLLDRASAAHRARILRLLVWARRLSILYGGAQLPVRTRTSQFILVQRMGRAVAALCQVAFWGDVRALTLIDAPEYVG